MSIADVAPELSGEQPGSRPEGEGNPAAGPPARRAAAWARFGLIVAACYSLVALGLAATSALPVSLHIAGHDIALHQVHDLFFRFSLIGTVLVPLIFLLEVAVIGWRASSIRELVYAHSATMRSDLVCFVLGHLRLFRWPQIIMTFGLTLVSGIAVHQAFVAVTGWNPSFDAVPLVPRIMIFYLIYTFLDYWAHRFDHMSLLWPMHRFHHAAESFVVFTAARGHPGSAMTQVAVKTFPMAAIGMSMTNIIDLNMLMVAIEYFIHSRLPFRLGWVGRWIVQSPLHHRMHHIRVYDGRSWNYGTCPLWDQMFGTWREVDYNPVEIGIEYEYRHGAWIVNDVLRDYGEFLSSLAGLGRHLLFPSRRSRAASAAGTPAADASVNENSTTTIRDAGHEVRFEEFLALQPAPANTGSAADGPSARA